MSQPLPGNTWVSPHSTYGTELTKGASFSSFSPVPVHHLWLGLLSSGEFEGSLEKEP